MFDFLQNIAKSKKERSREALSAYLDDQLAPAERSKLEQQLAADESLRDQLTQMQFWQTQMRALPRRRVPRNFTLDPALYGRPRRQPLAGAYPVLRAATAVTAFLFVIALVTNLYLGDATGGALDSAVPVAMMEMAVEEAAPAEADVQESARVDDLPAGEQTLLEESAEEEAPAASADFAQEAELSAAAEAEAPSVREIVEGTALPPPPASEAQGAAATAREAPPQIESELLIPESETAAEAPPQIEAVVPENEAAADEEQAITAVATPTVAPVAQDEAPAPTAPSTNLLTLLALGFGVLFVLLAVLTLLARSQQ